MITQWVCCMYIYCTSKSKFSIFKSEKVFFVFWLPLWRLSCVLLLYFTSKKSSDKLTWKCKIVSFVNVLWRHTFSHSTNFKVQFYWKPQVFNRFNKCHEMTKMNSSCATQNPFTNTLKHKFSCIDLKCHTKSIMINCQSAIQNHHHCPKRELIKKSTAIINHVF